MTQTSRHGNPDEDFSKSDRSARLLRTLKYVEAVGESGIRPSDLAKKLGVSRRTAYRDLKALEMEVDIPIWNEHGRWGVSQSGLLPALRFSRDEALAIVLAARLLAKFATGYDPELGAALMKLGGMLDEPLRSAVERTVSQLHANLEHRPLSNAWFIVDVGSDNGVFVNDDRVPRRLLELLIHHCARFIRLCALAARFRIVITHPHAPPVLYKTNIFFRHRRGSTLPMTMHVHTRRAAAAARRRLALLLALTAILPAALLLLSALLAATRHPRTHLAALAALPTSL